MSRRRGRHYAPRRSNRPAAIATVAVASGAATLSALTDGASAGTMSAASLRVGDNATGHASYAAAVKPTADATPEAVQRAIQQRSQQAASRSQQRTSAARAAAALRTKATNAAALKRLSLSTAAKSFAAPVPAAAPAGRHAATTAPVATAPKTTPVATYSGDPKSIAMSMLALYGWGSGQFGCLDNLWTKESGWRVGATNGSSGAYGIPQSLPGSKMASAGGDWRTNPATQIRWGLGYIRATYGSPCGAWSHSVAMNWY